MNTDSSLEPLSPCKQPKLTEEWSPFPIWKQTDLLTAQEPVHFKQKRDLEPEDKGYTNKWYAAVCFGVTVSTVQKSGKLSHFWRAEYNAPDSNLTADTEKKTTPLMQYGYLWQGFSVVRQASKSTYIGISHLDHAFVQLRSISATSSSQIYMGQSKDTQNQSWHAARLSRINLSDSQLQAFSTSSFKQQGSSFFESKIRNQKFVIPMYQIISWIAVLHGQLRNKPFQKPVWLSSTAVCTVLLRALTIHPAGHGSSLHFPKLFYPKLGRQ